MERGQELKLYQDALDQVELADRIGFDWVWQVEHHFLEEYSHSSAPEVFLAAASQRTKRIRLGHGSSKCRYGQPSGADRGAHRDARPRLERARRLRTGESSSSAELGGFGVRRTEKRDQWQDAIDAITRMFVEEPFAGWSSEYVRMPPRNVLPKTVQKPHPPLWVACSRRETIQFAARNGIGALTFSFVEPEDAGKWVDEYYRIIASDECVPAGFAVNPNVTVVLPMMLHEDEATAIDRGIDGAHFFAFALAHYGPTPHDPGRTNVWEEFQERRDARGFSREQIIANAETLNVNVGSLRGAVGTPAQVIDLIQRYESAGVDQISFVLQSGPNKHEHICESLELFGKAVLPHFTEGREEREAAKAERPAPAIEAAPLAAPPPARHRPVTALTRTRKSPARTVRAVRCGRRCVPRAGGGSVKVSTGSSTAGRTSRSNAVSAPARSACSSPEWRAHTTRPRRAVSRASWSSA